MKNPLAPSPSSCLLGLLRRGGTQPTFYSAWAHTELWRTHLYPDLLLTHFLLSIELFKAKKKFMKSRYPKIHCFRRIRQHVNSSKADHLKSRL